MSVISKAQELAAVGADRFSDLLDAVANRRNVLLLGAALAPAAIGILPDAANAQGAPVQQASLAKAPEAVCALAADALRDYVRANVSSFSQDDRAQLGVLNQWIRAGCQGTVRLQRDMPNVAVGVVFIQTRLGNRYRLTNHITLG